MTGLVLNVSFWPELEHKMAFVYARKDDVASCKWCDAQRAMRNRQYIGYTLGPPLERNVRGRLFDSNGGGGLSNFVWTDNLFSAWTREIYFHVAWVRENLFSCTHGKPQSTEAVNFY